MTRYLEEALELAAKGEGQASPNPLVGAVIERHGEVVGRGFHTWAGVKHAEVLALEEAQERARGGDHVCVAGALLASRADAAVH